VTALWRILPSGLAISRNLGPYHLDRPRARRSRCQLAGEPFFPSSTLSLASNAFTHPISYLVYCPYVALLTSRLVYLSRSTTATSSSNKSRILSTSRRPGNSGASSSSDTLKARRGRSSSSLSRRGSGRWVLLPSRSIEHRSIDRATTLYYAVPGGSACGVEGNTRRCGTWLAGCRWHSHGIEFGYTRLYENFRWTRYISDPSHILHHTAFLGLSSWHTSHEQGEVEARRDPSSVSDLKRSRVWMREGCQLTSAYLSK
jgi:hypothetical protein